MHSTLSDAVARCQLRRLRRVASAAPLPVGGVALVVTIAPFALYRAGRVLGVQLAGAVGEAGVSRGLVVGPMLAALAAGVVLAVASPGRSALGAQIAAGPVGGVAAVVAIALVPVAGGLLVLLPSLVALCIGLGRELPGGVAASLALGAAVLAAVPVGALLSEAALAARRGHRRRAAAILVSSIAWVAAGTVLGAGPLGPLALVAAALRGERPGWLAAVVALAVLAIAGVGWVAVAAARPAVRPTPARLGRPLGRRRVSVVVGLGLLLTRRSDVRLATAGAAVFGLAGTGLAVLAAAPPPSPFLLGTTTALLGALLCPLAIGGVLADGRWLWRAAPAGPYLVSRRGAVVGGVGAAVPVAVVGGCAVTGSGAGLNSVGIVAALVVVGSGLALLAGSVVPLRRSGAGDQLTTFAAFAALAVAASLVTGVTAPRLVSIGAPDVLVVCLVAAVAVSSGLAGLRFRLGAVDR